MGWFLLYKNNVYIFAVLYPHNSNYNLLKLIGQFIPGKLKVAKLEMKIK